jgi:hypothetical protein
MYDGNKILSVSPAFYVKDGLEHELGMTDEHIKDVIVFSKIVEINRNVDISEKTEGIPYVEKAEGFLNHKELEEFYKENKDKINKSLLSIDVSTDSDQGVYVVNEQMNFVKYFLGYESQSDSEFINSYVVTEMTVYCTELGTSTNKEQDVLYQSFSFAFVSRGKIDGISTDLRFEFLDMPSGESAWDRVACIYDGDDVVGEVYFRFKLDISDSWLENFLYTRLVVLK